MSITQKYILFNEYLDSIFYSGYANELSTQDYQSYIFQFNQFKTLYA